MLEHHLHVRSYWDGKRMLAASLIVLFLLAVLYTAWPVCRAFLPLEIDGNEAWNAYHADDARRAGFRLYPDPKLLTKLSGFLISCAMPAVSWPSEASFSVWTSRSWAVRSSSSDLANSRVRASTLSNNRTFSIRESRLGRQKSIPARFPGR